MPLAALVAGTSMWTAWMAFSQQAGPGSPQHGFFFTLLILVATIVLSELLRPKPDIENARPAGIGDFQFPTATEGRVVPLIWGRVLIKGPNVVWYGDLQQDAITEKVKTGLWSSTRITKGFRYNLGIQFALARGPNVVLRQLRIGEEQAFSGTVTTGNRFDVNDRDFLGGDKFGQGGVQATFDFYGGETTQAVNAYLDTNDRQRIATAITPTAPRYTGTSHVVMREFTGAAPTSTNRGAYVGNTTSVEPYSFECERTPALFSGQTAGENLIGSNGDVNPINVIYEILTNVEWGFGYSPSTVDASASSSFLDASDSIIAESNGFSMLLDRTMPSQDLLGELQRQVDGVVFLNHRTGLWTIQLVRGASDPRFGYDPAMIPQFTDTEIKELKDFIRGSWEDTTNQISVKYNKRDDEYKESYALAQDMANAIILSNGSFLDPVSNPGIVDFPGVKNSALASNLAWRELRGQSFPLARATFVTNRKFWELTIAGVFRWTNTRLFDAPIVMRATRINYGTLQQNDMTIDAVQSPFSFEAASMGTPGATGWTPPAAALVAFPAAQQTAFEAPRGIIVRDPSFSGDDTISKVWCGARRQGGEVAFEIRQSNAPSGPPASYNFDSDVVAFLRIGQLDSALDAGTAIPTTAITVNSTPDAQTVLEALFFDTTTLQDMGVDLVQLIKINDEFMLVSDASINGADVDLDDVYRGVLGTGQANHAVNDDVFMLFVGGGLTETTFPNTNDVDIELRMKRSTAIYAGAVTLISLTMARRALRPYPPPAVFYNGSGSRFNTPALEGDGAGLNGVGFDVDWHRSRHTATDEVQELLADDVPDVALSTEFRVQVRTDPTGSNNLVFDSGWVTGTGPITPTQAAVINQDAAGTEMDIAIDSRHDIQAETDLENNSPLTHRVTPTSARSSQFYLGGDLRASDSSNTFVVASATIHNVTIGASYGTSNVEEDINGGGFSVVISSGGTTAALNGGVALSVSDTVVLRHTVNESPDPNFVEIDDGTSDVAYGAFSA